MERLADRDADREDRHRCEQAHDEADRAPPPPARPTLHAIDHAW